MANTQNPPAVPPTQPAPPQASTNTTPRFSPQDVTVVFLLGGPGSGKGTQSANLVRDYGFLHLSAGDLLRAEQVREGSQYGDLIRTYIKEGKIVPMEITVALLSNAMAEALAAGAGATADGGKKKARFLIDGFPRKLDQAVFFEDTVCPSEMTLFLDCPEEVMEKRLLKRGETSGRDDDNAESIRKRFRVFVETSMPVVRAFEEQQKVLSVSATGTVDEVYARIREGLEEKGVQPV
jgi:UMP-CMP kinase